MSKQEARPGAVTERRRPTGVSTRGTAATLPVGKSELTELVAGLMARQAELEAQVEGLRQAKEEIERSRNKYLFLYDFAPVGYFTLSRDGGIQTVNLTGARLLGTSISLLLGRRFDQFVADENRFIFSDFLGTVFASRNKQTCRLRLAKEGEPLFVRIEATATETGDECHAVLVDITERRRAEEALRESEYNLSKAQTMSHVGSWRSDPQTGELVVSDELLRILGLSRTEATQEVFADVVHPEDHQTVLDHLRLGSEEGKSYEIEHRLLLRDGTSKWVYTIVEPSVNYHGKVERLYGTTQDITERKQAEVELRSQKNELQAIFDAVNDGVMVFDHTGRIQNLNHVCPEFFPPEVLAGGSCRDIFHPETPVSPQHCPVERALRGERVEISLGSTRKGTKIRYVDVTASTIEDGLGEKNRALVVIRDMTEKRHQELQLIQAEKMSSLGVLATGVAHEINNPLTSVAGYAEALLRRFRDDSDLGGDDRLADFEKYLNVIVRESYHCKGIIDCLLNFGRKSDGFVGGVDINDILMQILELLRHQSEEARIDTVTNLQEALPPVYGDPSGLRQVFMNLLVNARQSIAGEGAVEISTRLTDDQDVCITVRDTGCGIAPDDIEKIWDPFFTTKMAGKGIGLGLALTYTIVKRHGGDISLESRVGTGSVFTVRLPVCRIPAAGNGTEGI